MTLSSASGLDEVAAAVSAALERHGIEAALTGGACASLWSGGRYSSLDLDFIVTAPATRKAQDDAMSSVGFVREGDRYVHPVIRFWVEFPRGPLAIGSDLAIRPVEIAVGKSRVRGLSATAGRGGAPGGHGGARLVPALLLALAGLATPTRSVAQPWSGFVEVKGWGYADRALDREPWIVGYATAQATFEARLAPSVRLLATARGELWSSGDRDLFLDLADRDLRRAPLSLREAWISWGLAPTVDLDVGRFLLGWGKTDGYSPADAFLPRDLTDPFSDEKLPLWGLRTRGQAGAFRFDGVFVPLGTPWRVPVSSPRFAPVEETVAGLPVVLVDGEVDLPRAGWGALRLLATFGDWDVGAWGRTGIRPAPLLTPRPDLAFLDGDAVAVPADRRFAREDAAGIELSRVVGAWVLRAEGAALLSDDPELGDALIWTVGAERALGDGTLVLTFAANARGTPVDPILLFDRAILPAFIAIWQRAERWGSWRVGWTQGLAHGDGLLKLEGAWSATDALALTLGADLPYGSRYGPFGARPDLKRARAGARWSF